MHLKWHFYTLARTKLADIILTMIRLTKMLSSYAAFVTLLGLLMCAAAAAKPSFHNFVQSLYPDAAAAGVSWDTSRLQQPV